jgi:hypothetical protein
MLGMVKKNGWNLSFAYRVILSNTGSDTGCSDHPKPGMSKLMETIAWLS